MHECALQCMPVCTALGPIAHGLQHALEGVYLIPLRCHLRQDMMLVCGTLLQSLSKGRGKHHAPA